MSRRTAVRTSQPLTADSAAAVKIQRQFAKLLDGNPSAILNATRDSGGHVVLNADDLFKCWPEYKADSQARRWLGPLLYHVARKFIDRLYLELLTAPPVTGGAVRSSR